MRQSSLISLFPVFVLLSGLASCAPDKKTMDVYAAAPPTLSGQDLKEWSLRDNRAVDMNDALDFAEAHPQSLKVTTNCLVDGHQHEITQSFRGRSNLIAFEILPREVWLFEKPENHAQCGFEMDLYDSSGANHIFHLSSVPVTDSHHGRVRIKIGANYAEDARVPRISLSQSAETNFETDVANSAKLQLRCLDFDSDQKTFSNGLALGLFDLEHPKMLPGRSAEALSAHYIQNCRALVTASDGTQGLTNLFQIVLPLQPLELRTTATPISQNPTRSSFAHVFRKQAQVLWEWTISNNEPVPRKIRYTKIGRATKINIYDQRFDPAVASSSNSLPFPIVRQHSYLSVGQVIRNWLYYEPQESAGAADTVEEFVREIPARGSVRIQAILRPTQGRTCAPLALTLQDSEPLQIAEWDSDGRVQLGQMQLQPPKFLNLSAYTQQALADSIPMRPFCDWN